MRVSAAFPNLRRPSAAGLGRGALVALGAVAYLALAALVLHLAVGLGQTRIALLVLVGAGGLTATILSPSIGFLYLALSAPVIVALDGHSGPWGPGKLTLYGLILLTSVAGGLQWLSARPQRVGLGPAAAMLAFYLVYLLGHVVGADDRGAAFQTLVTHNYHWAFLVLPLVLLRERWQARAVLLFVAGLGVFLALASVAVWLVGARSMGALAQTGRYERVHLAFGTANSLGIFLSICFFVLLHAVRVKGAALQWAKRGASLLLLLAIVLTFSRRCWVAVGLLLMLHLVRNRKWGTLLFAVLVGVWLSWTSLSQVRERAESIVDPHAEANEGRTREIGERLDFLFGDGVSLVGWGLEKAATTSNVHDVTGPSRRIYFHNYYLTLYYLGGALATLFYLAVQGGLLLGLRRALRRARSPATRGALAAGGSVVVVLLLTGLFGTGNVTFPANYLSALVPGVGFALLAQEPAAEADEEVRA